MTDLRVIQYCLTGFIWYKLDYNDTFNALPRMPNKVSKEDIFKFPKFHENPQNA